MDEHWISRNYRTNYGGVVLFQEWVFYLNALSYFSNEKFTIVLELDAGNPIPRIARVFLTD